MSCCRCQTSQQQRQPHCDNRKRTTPSTLLSLAYSPVTCEQTLGCPPAPCHSRETESHQNFGGCSSTPAQPFSSVLRQRTHACTQETSDSAFPSPKGGIFLLLKPFSY